MLVYFSPRAFICTIFVRFVDFTKLFGVFDRIVPFFVESIGWFGIFDKNSAILQK